MLGPCSNVRCPSSGPLLLCGLTLSACAPTLNLGNVIDTTSPSRAGPLQVGQTWAVSGQLANVSVSKTLAVPRLVEVQDGKGTLSVADQANAVQLPSGNYQYVSYTSSDQLKKTRLRVERGGGGRRRGPLRVLGAEQREPAADRRVERAAAERRHGSARHLLGHADQSACPAPASK